MKTTSGPPDYVNEKSEVTNSATILFINDPTFHLPASGETSILMDTITPESTQVNVSDTDDAKNLGKKVKSILTKADGEATIGNIAASSRAAAVSFIVFGIFAIIPILQVIIGRRYADQCPIQPRIPHYLVVAGVVGLAVYGILVIEILLSLLLSKTMRNDDPGSVGKVTVAGGCGICCLSLVLICLSTFLIGWFIAGCIWVFSVWNDVQYTRPTGSNYCHQTLYRFAFWLLLISILSHIFSCIRSCFQAIQQRNT